MDEVTLQLEKWRVATRTIIHEQGGTFGETLQIVAKTFDFGNQLGAALSAIVLTENVDSFKHPVTWWDAFKERWYPKFWLKWYPVKYKRIDVKALYPRLQGVKIPEKGNEPVWRYIEHNEPSKRIL